MENSCKLTPFDTLELPQTGVLTRVLFSPDISDLVQAEAAFAASPFPGNMDANDTEAHISLERLDFFGMRPKNVA